MELSSQKREPPAECDQVRPDGELQSQKSANKDLQALNNNSAAGNANSLSNNHSRNQETQPTNKLPIDGHQLEICISSTLHELITRVSNLEHSSSSSSSSTNSSAATTNDDSSQHSASADDDTDEKPSDSLEKGAELSPDDATCDLVIDSDLPPSVEEESPAAASNEQNNQSSETAPPTEAAQQPPKSSSTSHEDGKANNSSSNSLDEQDHSANTLQSQSNDNLSQATTVELSQSYSTDSTAVIKSELSIGCTGSSSISNSRKNDIEMEDPHEKTKDMATLRNVQLSPPPPPPQAPPGQDVADKEATLEAKHDDKANKSNSSARSARRKRTLSTESDNGIDESTDTGGRSKRQRVKTQLFQAGEPTTSPEPSIKVPSSAAKSRPQRVRTSPKPPTPTPTRASATSPQEPNHDLQDVIFYEKNDYLALRNEDDSFFLCQLAENVRVKRPVIKIRWLDTNDDGKTYFLTQQYDRVPQKSIIMPVALNKLKSEKKGTQFYTLDDQDKDNIMDRLTRSLNAPKEESSSQETNLET